ncbi:MAG: VCBS repeat-containing protein [Euryarchaeota archaeon]|nr:VCBS repeat-containing protein [Euryarchaeota archaeon]
MRGRSAILKSTACLIVLLLTLSGASVALTAAPELTDQAAGPSASSDAVHPFAWTEELSVPALEDEARGIAEALDARHVPPPDTFAPYAMLDDDGKRLAWRAYLLRIVLDHGSGDDDTEMAAQDIPAGGTTDGPDPHGLRGLWSLELHGRPRELVSAGEGAGVFLVTQYGVLRFTEPGASPVWMTKPGYVQSAHPVDFDGDGGVDLVLHVSGYRHGDETPSVVVIDGDTGAVLFSGFQGDDRFLRLAVTDADADGTPDAIGWTASGLFRAARLDGTTIHETPLPEGQDQGYGAFLFWVIVYGFPSRTSGFGDIDGDGVADMIVSGFDRVSALLFVVSATAGTDGVRVYSGRDGSEIWSASIPTTSRSSGFYPYIAGDLDGDGREDITLYHFTFSFTGLLVYVMTVESGLIGLAGADGSLLFDDRQQYVFVILLVVARSVQIKEGAGYQPVGIRDLDGDGTAELVVLHGERGSLEVQGRVPTVPGGPTQVVWESSAEIPTEWEDMDGFGRLRDVDADGDVEVVVWVTGESEPDESGNISVSSRVFIADPAGVAAVTPDRLIAYYDVDEASGQAYVWTRGDEWSPIAADGTVGDGMKLIVSTQPVMMQDVSGDKVPDILLQKTRGMRWIDGANGRILSEHDETPGTYLMEVGVQPEGVVVLERVRETGVIILRNLATGAALWRFDPKTLDEERRPWPTDLVDVDGDRRLDLVLRAYRFTEREDGDYERSMTVWTVDPAAAAAPWSVSVPDGQAVHAVDAVPERLGSELTVLSRDRTSGQRALQLVVPGEGVRWQTSLGSFGEPVDAADGLILVSKRGEGAVLTVLDAADGSETLSVALDADSDVTAARFVDLDRDGGKELVASWSTAKGETATYHALVHDVAGDVELARFKLFGTEDSDGRGFCIMVSGGAMHCEASFPHWGLEGPLGDVDGDGRVDLAFTEKEVPMIRSMAGEILAVGPKGRVVAHEDLNGDGRGELGIVTDSGRLRFFAYDAAVLTVEEDSGIRTVEAPDVPVEEEDAKDFFAKEKDTPMVAVPLVVALSLFLVAVLRRRR